MLELGKRLKSEEMKALEIQQLKRNVTIGYLLAISLIAILSTAAYYWLQSALSRSYDTALIVNISGRQRMLSQHIALEAHRLYLKRFSEMIQESRSAETLGGMLRRNALEMKQANERLSSGRIKMDSLSPLSPEVKQLYFGQSQLAQRVRDYVKLALALAKQQEPVEALHLLKQIDARSEGLLSDLNRMVKLYQQEGEQKLTQVKRTEALNLGVTLLVLVLEVLFIFRPMVKRIVELAQAEQRILDSLQDLVALRTSHLEEANQQLANLAQHDALTGLLNRLNMENDIEAAVTDFQRKQAPFALLMFDIDWFKRINDNFGHNAGDKVLIDISNLLKASVRHDDKVYRAGGEEFVVLLNYVPFDRAESKAEEVLWAVANYDFPVDGLETNLTISGGFYHTSLVEPSGVKEVLKLVDIALYQAKKQGRNRIVRVAAEAC